MANGKEIKRLQRNVLIARSALEKARKIDKEVKDAVLNTFHFYRARNDNTEPLERVTDSLSDYLMDENSFGVYCERISEKFKETGINNPVGENYTWQFQSLLRDAENELIDFCLSIVPKKLASAVEKARENFKYRAELIEIDLRLTI
jgi:hypothetical protein